MPAVICVAVFTVHEFTVIPVPKSQLAPASKFVPTSVSLCVCPTCPDVGETLLSVGGGGGAARFTVNALERVPLCPSGLVTITLRVPAEALAAIAMLLVNCVAELKVHEFTVMPVPKLHVAPLAKLVPLITTFRTCPCVPLV